MLFDWRIVVFTNRYHHVVFTKVISSGLVHHELLLGQDILPVRLEAVSALFGVIFAL